MVIWICGPSGAGKTTIGRALHKHLKLRTPSIFLMDGDEFRAAMGHDLGFTVEDRHKNGLRMVRLSQLLESQGIAVICCGATIHPEVQAFGSAELLEYHQVFVEASFETLLRRDTKDIYRRALEGQMVDVVGVDIKLAIPATPHLLLNNDEDRDSVDGLVRQITGYIEASRRTPLGDTLPQASRTREGLDT